MGLVAAIASGVLINTAGFLQTQAEDTGTESTEQVADNLNVITEVGNVSDGDGINELRVGVQPASGSDDINLAELTVQYVSDGEFANLVVGNDTTTSDDTATGDTNPDDIYTIGGTAPDATAANRDVDHRSAGDERYNIDVITAENEDDVVMTDGADRYELIVPLNLSAASESDQVKALDGNTGADTQLNDFDSDDDTNVDSYQYNGDLKPLTEGAEVELTITTEVGAQTVAFLQVPDSLSGDDAGSTVNL